MRPTLTLVAAAMLLSIASIHAAPVRDREALAAIIPPTNYHPPAEDVVLDLAKRQCGGDSGNGVPPGYESREGHNASRWGKRQCGSAGQRGGGPDPYRSGEGHDASRWGKRQVE